MERVGRWAFVFVVFFASCFGVGQGVARPASPAVGSLDEAWTTFEAPRLGISFEHPESMRAVGYLTETCTPDLTRVVPDPPPPQPIFCRLSGTEENQRFFTAAVGRRMQVAVWLGAADDGWGIAPFTDPGSDGTHVVGPVSMYTFPETPCLAVTTAVRSGETRDGAPVLRRVSPAGDVVVYRIDGEGGRVIHIMGMVREGDDAAEMKPAELGAFDRLARSVVFGARRTPETEACGDRTRWHGDGFSLCVPRDWVESGWPGGPLPQNVLEPLPPVRLSFDEGEQRFLGLVPACWRGIAVPKSERELIPFPVAGVARRGPYPAEHDGEPVVAGTWAWAVRWLSNWEPTQGQRLLRAGLFSNEKGQVGFLRVIEGPPSMTSERSVSVHYSLFAPGRVEYRLSMSADHHRREARTAFEHIARSFVLTGEAGAPPRDFPVKR